MGHVTSHPEHVLFTSRYVELYAKMMCREVRVSQQLMANGWRQGTSKHQSSNYSVKLCCMWILYKSSRPWLYRPVSPFPKASVRTVCGVSVCDVLFPNGFLTGVDCDRWARPAIHEAASVQGAVVLWRPQCDGHTALQTVEWKRKEVCCLGMSEGSYDSLQGNNLDFTIFVCIVFFKFLHRRKLISTYFMLNVLFGPASNLSRLHIGS